MPLSTAEKFAWSLANSLMAPVILIETDQGFSVIPSDEWDGDPEDVVREYDPWAM